MNRALGPILPAALTPLAAPGDQKHPHPARGGGRGRTPGDVVFGGQAKRRLAASAGAGSSSPSHLAMSPARATGSVAHPQRRRRGRACARRQSVTVTVTVTWAGAPGDVFCARDGPAELADGLAWQLIGMDTEPLLPGAPAWSRPPQAPWAARSARSRARSTPAPPNTWLGEAKGSCALAHEGALPHFTGLDPPSEAPLPANIPVNLESLASLAPAGGVMTPPAEPGVRAGPAIAAAPAPRSARSVLLNQLRQ